MFMSILLVKNHIPHPIPGKYIFFIQDIETDLFLYIPDACWFQKVLSTHKELQVTYIYIVYIYIHKELILKCSGNCTVEEDLIFWVFH